MYPMRPAARLTENEGEESVKKLPEELVERVVALMPFPSILKARLLSRSWLSKLSLQGPQDDEVTKHIRTMFHKLVGESSNNWGTFTAWIFKDDVWVYCPGSHSWRRLLSLSRIFHIGWGTLKVQTAGAHMLLYPSCYFYNNGCLHITNVLALTTSWRFLPLCPQKHSEKFFCLKLVSYPEFQTFRVILLCSIYDKDLNVRKCIAQVYDSKSDEWSRKELVNLAGMLWKGVISVQDLVYLDGLLYLVGTWLCLLSFNIEEGTWEEVNLSFPQEVDRSFRDYAVDLVVCNDTLLEILTQGGSIDKLILNHRVLKVDLKLKVLKEVTRGPPPPLNAGIFTTQSISHGDSIFFGVEEVSGRVFTYNIKEDQWGCLHFPLSFSRPFHTSWKYERGTAGEFSWKVCDSREDLSLYWKARGIVFPFSPAWQV